MRKLLMSLGARANTTWARKTPCMCSPRQEPLNRIDAKNTSHADVVASANHVDSARSVRERLANDVMDSVRCATNRYVRCIAAFLLPLTAVASGFANPATEQNAVRASFVGLPAPFSPHLFILRIEMAKDDLTPLIQDLLYAEDYRLLHDPVGQAVRRTIDAGVADDFICGQLRERVAKHKISQAFDGPYRMPQLTDGDIAYGFDMHRKPILVPVQYFNGHSLCVAGSGAGKTVRSRWLALQIIPLVDGCWLFDFRKREFQILVPYLSRLGVELIDVGARQLRLNPLQLPDNVNPYEWASRAADLLVLILRLPARADKLVHTTLLELFESFGVMRGGTRFPTLFDLREAIACNERANPQARQAILDSLDPILLSLRDVLAYRKGWSTADLSKKHIVFELGEVAEADKDLILNTLIIQEFTSRVCRGISNPQMDLWISCDEAARLVSASSATGGLSDLIGLVRGTGVGIDLSVQSSDVAASILSNTALKSIGRCGSATDYDVVGSAMGLTADQRRYLTHTLIPGLFVGQVGEGDWRYPFLYRIPPMNFSNANTASPTCRVELPHSLPCEGKS